MDGKRFVVGLSCGLTGAFLGLIAGLYLGSAAERGRTKQARRAARQAGDNTAKVMEAALSRTEEPEQ